MKTACSGFSPEGKPSGENPVTKPQEIIMSQQLSQNFLQLMAQAEVPIEDARWFHCVARRAGILREADLSRYFRIQSMLADRLCYG
jgi:hypothetical protein